MVCQTCGADYRSPEVRAYEQGYNDGVEQERASLAKDLGSLKSVGEVAAFVRGYVNAHRLTHEACRVCTVDKAEPVECMAWDDECLTCHLTRCRACQDDLADQAAAEAATDGRAP